MQLRNPARTVGAVALCAAATAYCLHYGRIGYLAQDHATVFDGGWRVISGQVPYRDFVLPNAIVPVVLQAGFFALFGVTWFAYCLHAAIFNGLFALLVLCFLRRCGLPSRFSFVYGAASAVVYYPPAGIPMQDGHAWFFTFLLVAMAVFASGPAGPRERRTIWLLLPAVTAVAYLSKQIPTVFGAALAFPIVLWGARREAAVLGRWLGAGAAALLSLLALAWAALGIDRGLVETYFLRLPADTGSERLARLPGRLLRASIFLGDHLELLFPVLVVVLALAVAILVALRGRARPGTERTGGPLPPAALAGALVATCVLYAALTNNQFQGAFPVAFVGVGLAHLSLLRAAGALPATSSGGSGRPWAALATGVIVAGTILGAWRFDRTVNATRVMHDLRYAGGGGERGLPKALSFMVWAVPKSYRGTPKDLMGVIDFFSGNPAHFWLFGDSSILYALTGSPSVNPALWFHPGQTIPRPRSPLLPAYEDLLLGSMHRYGVRYVVLEDARGGHRGGRTWSGAALRDLPRVARMVEESGAARARFGPFTIVELVGGVRP